MYSFDTDGWEVFDKEFQKNESFAVQYRVVDLDKSLFCKTNNKFTFFPDKYNLRDGTKLCKRFGGARVDISTRKAQEELNDWFGPMKNNKAFSKDISFATSFMFTDEEELNVWRNYETGELPEDPIPFTFGEPNGWLIENCVLFYNWLDEDKWIGTYIDTSCNSPLAVACQDIQSVFTLRGWQYKEIRYFSAYTLYVFAGLCSKTALDTTYTMVEGDINKKRYFAGNNGWKLNWDNSFAVKQYFEYQPG